MYDVSMSGPAEKKGRRRRKLLYPHPKLSLGLVLYRPFILKYVDVLDYSSTCMCVYT